MKNSTKFLCVAGVLLIASMLVFSGTYKTEYAALGDNICSVLAFASFICFCINLSLWYQDGIMERWDKEVAKKEAKEKKAKEKQAQKQKQAQEKAGDLWVI